MSLSAINLIVSIVNLLVLLALAGSMAKLIKYLGGEQENPPMSRVSQRLDMSSGQLVGPDHLDQNVLSGRVDPYSDGVTQRPSARNWDGVARSDE